MSTRTPIIDPRTRADVLASMLRRAPGYLPGLWRAAGQSADGALMQVFARYMELLIEGLNQMPDRSLLAFLDMLGVELLPAQAARVPLVFTLMKDSPLDPLLPADSQVAAPAQLLPPSLLPKGEENVAAPQSAIFSTAQTVTLTRAGLRALYSVRPDTDEYADHLARVAEGFTLFRDLQPTEHALYLGHNRLFALAGEASVRLAFDLGASGRIAATRPINLTWEYLSKDGWLSLVMEDDGTRGLTRNGEILLRKSCGPDAKEETIAGHTSFWLRGRMTNPLPSMSGDNAGAVPVIDTITARVGFTKRGLLPEAAFNDLLPLDTSNNFFPFGPEPARYSTFYLASRDAFQRNGARIALAVNLSEAGRPRDDLDLVWEYHDGTDWRRLDVDRFGWRDGTKSFTFGGKSMVSFLRPSNWRETNVNGVRNFWLRVRIAKGNYGKPLHWEIVNGAPVARSSTLAAPVVEKLTLEYTYLTDSTELDDCLAFNDFTFIDYTRACRWPRLLFEPFKPNSDRRPTVYVGFDHALPSGLVSLYVQVPPEAAIRGTTSEVPAFVWEYRTADGWDELGVLDETLGFRRSGMIQFIGQRNAVATPGLGGNLYRIRARLKQGAPSWEAPIAGLWPNAVWGYQRTTVEGEVLGTSDGSPGQSYRFPRERVPVLEGEFIEVREWTGRGPDWNTVVEDVAAQDWRSENSLLPDAVKSVWVRWHARPHLYDSSPTDRHYVIERTTGLVRFGDGRNGRIPPAGGRLVASYTSGGGLSGNVAPGAITELRTGVPYVIGVTNPVGAAGGATSEPAEAIRARGPEHIRHRGRGVSARDIEWIAREASPAVARARCLTGAHKLAERGGITLLVVPHGMEAAPRPTPELKRRVQEYVAERVTASAARRVQVVEAEYMPVGVVAQIVPGRAGEAAQVEARVLKRLNDFLHPLTGGTDGRGWEFGQPLYLSQIASVVEKTPGVDYALHLGLRARGELFSDVVPVEPDVLLTAGDHELKLTPGEF